MVGWRNPLRIPDCCYSSSFFSYTPIRPITATHRLAQHQEYCYTRNKSLWDPRPFTPDAFYTELVLQQKHFTPNSSCTRSPQHHTPFCTRTYLQHRPFTPETLLHQQDSRDKNQYVLASLVRLIWSPDRSCTCTVKCSVPLENLNFRLRWSTKCKQYALHPWTRPRTKLNLIH